MKKILFCLFLGISLLVNVVLSIFVLNKEKTYVQLSQDKVVSVDNANPIDSYFDKVMKQDMTYAEIRGKQRLYGKLWETEYENVKMCIRDRLKSGDKNVISNEKYVFYLDKTNKIHRLDKQNKHDIIIRKKPATEILCTEKKLFARVRNKKAYTKCVRDAADADEFADSGEDFYSDNLYCLDLRGREENKIWKGSYKWTN